MNDRWNGKKDIGGRQIDNKKGRTMDWCNNICIYGCLRPAAR